MQHDQLDFWAWNELFLVFQATDDKPGEQSALSELTRIMRYEPQKYLDLAFDYANTGLFIEANQVLKCLVSGNVLYPMLYYALGYFDLSAGDSVEARLWFQQPAQMPPELCFPFRLEEMLCLQAALGTNPQDGYAHYYLGNLLYDKKRYTEAISHWETAVQLAPSLSIPWRNLGIAYYNVLRDLDRARACYEHACQA